MSEGIFEFCDPFTYKVNNVSAKMKKKLKK